MHKKTRKIILSVILTLVSIVLLYPNFKSSILETKQKFIGLSESSTGSRKEVVQEVVQEESTIIDVVEKVSPSVVSIVIETLNINFFSGTTSLEESGIGTGFIVDSSGLIVTNSHVVDDTSGDFSVVLKDGTTYNVEKIHLDRYTDIAILEIVARDLPVVEFGDSDSLKVGQTAIAIGNALGKYQNTVTVGVVSGIARSLKASSSLGDVKEYENVIQTDAALNPGNSGGPLLNSAGQVIGINVATTYGADNISFAIPINQLKPVLDSFLKEGRIVKPFLGVVYTMITEDMSDLHGFPQGAFVSSVTLGSAADEAGIKRGDIITKIDNEVLGSDNTLARIIMNKKVGDKVDLVVDRDGEILDFTATLVEAPSDL